MIYFIKIEEVLTMKMFVFQACIVHTDKMHIVAGSPSEPCSGPVPYYLIEHEKGYVLCDTGFNYGTVQDAKKALPEYTYAAFTPECPEDGYVLNALNKVGIKPEEITYVICSHLHFDHCGGIGLFPNATYVVQRAELHYAFVPDYFMKPVYLREDFDQDVNWLILDGWNDNRYDLFDDGKLIICFTPGHTPGHMSLLLNLEEDGSIMLTIDACYSVENLEHTKIPGLSCDNSAYVKNLKMFQDMQRRGIKIITGHDPYEWDEIKKFPEFYK